jgi:hypothetical protein
MQANRVSLDRVESAVTAIEVLRVPAGDLILSGLASLADALDNRDHVTLCDCFNFGFGQGG